MTVTMHPPQTSAAPPAIPPDLRVPLRRVATLYRLGEQMLQAGTAQAALDIAAAGLVSEAGYATTWIALYDRDSASLRGTAGAGLNSSTATNKQVFPLSEHPFLRDIAERRQIDIVPDGQAQAEREGWGEQARAMRLRSMLRVPFGTDSDLLGMLFVSTTSDMIADEEATLMSLFATQITTALVKLQYDAERSAQMAALQSAAIAQERLLETVRELSTPAIPIHDGILVLPLVGNIDTGRAQQVMEAVLSGIAREHAAVVIIDVTGVPVIDTGVANHLVQVTQAALLLGARCLLVGIKPEVAQTLVQLGVDLRSIVTRSDLQAGVAFALETRGLRIVSSR